MMSRQLFYCSELSRRVAEKPYGTASIGDVWVLIEYTRAWGAKAVEESDLSSAVKEHLSRIYKTLPRSRVLFIKQERAPKERFDVFVVRTRERAPFVAKFQLESYEQLTRLDVAAVAASEAGAVSAGAVMTREPLFLVCTHGRRDKCCAKFGYALYKSLRAHVGNSVWQSSHVGGDRFAANLVCFPHGLFYAHVSEEAGGRITTEYAQERRLVLEGYRGRTCYRYAVQAAEFFLRRESGLVGVDDLRFLRREAVGENSCRVQFAAGARVYEVRITSRPSDFQNRITCHSMAEQRVIQYVLEDCRMTSDGGGQSGALARESLRGGE